MTFEFSIFFRSIIDNKKRNIIVIKNFKNLSRNLHVTRKTSKMKKKQERPQKSFMLIKGTPVTKKFLKNKNKSRGFGF